MGSMRFAMTAAFLAAASLGACAHGMEGNPNSQPYAGQPGGTIATQPQVASTVSYDPYATPAPFADMQAGSVAITPSATPPLNLSPQGASPMPQAAPRRTMPQPR
jgi:hypothetical protein